MTPEGRCAVCGGGKPYWKHAAGGSEYHPFTQSDTWRDLAHAFRTYAQHAPNCAYQPTYPEPGTATCDCAFDVLLDRYDRLTTLSECPPTANPSNADAPTVAPQSEPPPVDPLRAAAHVLSFPPHPDGYYIATARCSCGGFQWDADSEFALRASSAAWRSGWERHVAALAAPVAPAGLDVERLARAAHASYERDPTEAVPPLLALGQTVAEARRAAAMTLRGVADLTDLDFTYLSKIENGHARPSRKAAARLDHVLGGGILDAFDQLPCSTCAGARRGEGCGGSPAAPEGLDAERLAEAWANVMDGRRIGPVRIGRHTTTSADWRAIAREYAALANPEPFDGDGEPS